MEINDAAFRLLFDKRRRLLQLPNRRRGQIEDRNVFVGDRTKRRRFGELRRQVEDSGHPLPDGLGRFFAT